MSQDETSTLFAHRNFLTSELHGARSHDARIYLRRAICHEQLAYPDLAASDAYKALLLTDEVLETLLDGDDDDEDTTASDCLAVKCLIDVSDEDVEVTGEQRSNSCSSRQNCLHIDDLGVGLPKSSEHRQSLKVSLPDERMRSICLLATSLSFLAHKLLIRTLTSCGDLKTAKDFAKRALSRFKDEPEWLKEVLKLKHKIHEAHVQIDHTVSAEAGSNERELPEHGSVRREIYPWNSHDIDRYTPATIQFLNAEVAKVAPECEVRIVELLFLSTEVNVKEVGAGAGRTIKQLGVFSKTEIAAGQAILCEPSVLTANNRLHDSLCDACSAPLPPSSSVACLDCQDVAFCSDECWIDAKAQYHPAVCGRVDFDVALRDPEPRNATNALYLLLLSRTIAMAETQDVHPLDLREIKYLWGDFTEPVQSPSNGITKMKHENFIHNLPFSFDANIAKPFHLLEELDLDIFDSQVLERYDTWVVNTLLAKFRGVASARMGPRTGTPEVCAVHWRWSLANHSCAPNVRWEWPSTKTLADKASPECNNTIAATKVSQSGARCMTLIARQEDEIVRWSQEGGVGGIRSGREVLNHYCDVALPVTERREWAVGALGGNCMCERCIFEASANG